MKGKKLRKKLDSIKYWWLIEFDDNSANEYQPFVSDDYDIEVYENMIKVGKAYYPISKIRSVRRTCIRPMGLMKNELITNELGKFGNDRKDEE